MAGHGQAPSFKTDVHRAKTQRWADAKSYAYDGDDWAGYDEYNDYNAEQEDKPWLSSKPTGSRHPGQALAPMTQDPRKFDAPEQAFNSGLTGRNRSNSFDPGDDQRDNLARTNAPSANLHASMQQPIGHSTFSHGPPALLNASTESSSRAHGQPVFAETLHHNPAIIQPGGQQFGMNPNLPTSTRAQPSPEARSSSTANSLNSVAGNPSRRDHSPLQPSPNQRSPVGNYGVQNSVNTYFPPRKSSLTQTSPSVTSSSRSDPIAAAAAPQTRLAAEGIATDEGSVAPKLQTFIRPADIYKRMEAEKERERRSLDQSRPSMDASDRSASNESDISARPRQRGTTPSPSRSRSRSHSRSRQNPTEQSSSMETSFRLKQALETVPERKSEYMSGFSISNPALARAIGANMSTKAPSLPQISNPPSLPQTHRVSVFGTDLWNFEQSDIAPSLPSLPAQYSASVSPNLAGTEASRSLKHQASNGFRTAVHGAFDGANDEPNLRIPNTQSQVSRSNTDSTAGISPIIGRFAGMMTASERTSRLSDSKEPRSSGTDDKNTNYAPLLPMKDTPVHSRNISTDSAPYGQMTPKGRQIANPSPTNSPARSPGIVRTMHLPEASVAELGHAGGYEQDSSRNAVVANYPRLTELPIGESGQSSHYESTEADIPSELQSSSREDSAEAVENARCAPSAFLESRRNDRSVFGGTMIDGREMSRLGVRTTSPAKGRVRDLASKYDGISEIARSPTPSSSVASWTGSELSYESPTSPSRVVGDEVSTNTSTSAANRQLPTAALSFTRPHIPGSWVSYAQTSRASTPAPDRTSEAEEHNNASIAQQHEASDEEVDFTPTTLKRRLPGKAFNEPSGHLFQSAAAAGHALAESLMASMWLTGGENEREVDDDDPASSAQNTPRQPGHSHLGPPTEHVMDNDAQVTSTEPLAPPLRDALRDQSIPLQNTYLDHAHSSSDKNNLPPIQVTKHPEDDTIYMHTARRMSIESLGVAGSDVEDSHDASESDRLRRDIVRSLTPAGTNSIGPQIAMSSTASKDNRNLEVGRAIALTPQEFDSYWSGSPAANETSTEHQSTHDGEDRPVIEPLNASRARNSLNQMQSPPQQQNEPVTSTHIPSVVSPNFLGARFSWEGSRSVEGVPDSLPLGVSPVSKEATSDKALSGNQIETSDGRGPLVNSSATTPALFSGTSRDTYDEIEAKQLVTASQTPHASSPYVEAVHDDNDLNDHQTVASTSLQASNLQGLGITSSSFVPQSNTYNNYEPNSLPIEYADFEGPAELPGQMNFHSVHADAQPSVAGQPTEANESARSEIPIVRVTASRPHMMTNTSLRGSNRSNTFPRNNTFKDFAIIKNTSQRIDAFNQTRDEYANMHTGLNEWLVQMVTVHPDHAHLDTTPNRSNTHGGGIASTVGLGKLQAKLMRSGASGQAEDAPSPQMMQEDGRFQDPTKGRQTSQQTQSKTKDRLHLGGARSLLAKGRNKLKGNNSDKAWTSQPQTSPRVLTQGNQTPNHRSSRADLGMPISSPKHAGYIDDAARENQEFESDELSVGRTQQPNEWEEQVEKQLHVVSSRANSTIEHNRSELGNVLTDSVGHVVPLSERPTDENMQGLHAQTSSQRVLPRPIVVQGQNHSGHDSDPLDNDILSSPSSGYFPRMSMSSNRKSYPMYDGSQLMVKEGAYDGKAVLSPLTDYGDDDSNSEDAADTPDVDLGHPSSMSDVGVFGARGYTMWEDTRLENSSALPLSLRQRFDHIGDAEEALREEVRQATEGARNKSLSENPDATSQAPGQNNTISALQQTTPNIGSQQNMTTEKEVLPSVVGSHEPTLKQLERSAFLIRDQAEDNSIRSGVRADRPLSSVSNFSTPSNIIGEYPYGDRRLQNDVVSPLHTAHGSSAELHPMIESGLEVVDPRAHSQPRLSPGALTTTQVSRQLPTSTYAQRQVSSPLSNSYSLDPRSNATEYSLPGVGPAAVERPPPTKRMSRSFLSFRRSRSREAKSESDSATNTARDGARAETRSPPMPTRMVSRSVAPRQLSVRDLEKDHMVLRPASVPVEAAPGQRQEQRDAFTRLQDERNPPTELSGETGMSTVAMPSRQRNSQAHMFTQSQGPGELPAREQPIAPVPPNKLQRRTTSSDSVAKTKKRTSIFSGLFSRSESSEKVSSSSKRTSKLMKVPPLPSITPHQLGQSRISSTEHQRPPVPLPPQHRYGSPANTSRTPPPRPSDPIHDAHIQYLQSQGVVPPRAPSRSSTPGATIPSNPTRDSLPPLPVPSSLSARPRGSPQQPYYSIFPRGASPQPQPAPARNPRTSTSHHRTSSEAGSVANARNAPDPPPQYTTFAPPATPNPLQRSRENRGNLSLGYGDADGRDGRGDGTPSTAHAHLAGNAAWPSPPPPPPPIPPRSPDRSSFDASVGRRRSSYGFGLGLRLGLGLGHARVSSVEQRIAEEVRDGREGARQEEEEEEEEEVVVMSPVSWPGMEWVPPGEM